MTSNVALSIEKFLVSAGNAEQFDGNASVERALEKLGLPALYNPLPGMEVALMPHQAIGVAWMLEKEKGHEKGGCMADEMGLGKVTLSDRRLYASQLAHRYLADGPDDRRHRNQSCAGPAREDDSHRCTFSAPRPVAARNRDEDQPWPPVSHLPRYAQFPWLHVRWLIDLSQGTTSLGRAMSSGSTT